MEQHTLLQVVAATDQGLQEEEGGASVVVVVVVGGGGGGAMVGRECVRGIKWQEEDTKPG